MDDGRIADILGQDTPQVTSTNNWLVGNIITDGPALYSVRDLILNVRI